MNQNNISDFCCFPSLPNRSQKKYSRPTIWWKHKSSSINKKNQNIEHYQSDSNSCCSFHFFFCNWKKKLNSENEFFVVAKRWITAVTTIKLFKKKKKTVNPIDSSKKKILSQIKFTIDQHSRKKMNASFDYNNNG